MFKISKEYTWPVTVSLPMNGAREDVTFTATFKRMTRTEVEALSGQSDMTDKKFAEAVLLGWSGISDDNGELPFTPENIAYVLDIPGVANAIVVALSQSLSTEEQKKT